MARRIRTQAEWNVLTHMVRATGPTSAATRWRISSAALLVNVMARICDGCTPSSMRWAMRWVSTRVLPDPAPATTSSGPVSVHDGVELVRVQPVGRRLVRRLGRRKAGKGCIGHAEATLGSGCAGWWRDVRRRQRTMATGQWAWAVTSNPVEPAISSTSRGGRAFR